MDFSWPTEFTPQLVSWGIQKAGVQFRSPMAGNVESVEFAGSFWKCSVTLPDMTIDEGVSAQAFFARLAGGVDRVFVPYWLRPEPFGTMRGSPTLATTAARGAKVLAIAGSGTLKRGDMIGLDGTLFQVVADAIGVGGVITIGTVNPTRRIIASGTPVLWASPTIPFIVPSQSSVNNFEPGKHAPLAIDMEEA